MLKYIRNIKRSKISFIINLIGLTSGLACILLIYLWVKDELEHDKFHKADTHLFQMMTSRMVNGEFQTDSYTAMPMVNIFSESFPEIKNSVSITESYSMNKLTVNENDITSRGIYADKDFFEFFTFDLLAGSRESLLGDKYNIVLTEELAIKLFGTIKDVVGKSIKFDEKDQFVISGVIDNIPSNSSIQFDFVIPLSLYEEHSGIELTWGENVVSGYFLVQEGTTTTQLNSKMLKWLEEEGVDISKTRIFTRRFSDGYLYGNYENGIQQGGRIDYVRLFIIIGIVILLIACINFISLSTAVASDRLKEIGIKKVLGVKRKSIIIQLLGESTLLALVSFFISLLLVFLFLPSFNEIAGKQMTLNFSYDLILPFLLIVLVTGVLSGIYPAIYVSSFKPAAILSNNVSGVGGKEWVRKGLVIVQFTTSIILVVFTIVVYYQFSMIQNRNLGYDKDNVLYFEMDGEVIKRREAFLSELRRIPGVTKASSVFIFKEGLLGNDMVTNDINWPTKSPDETFLIEYRVVNYDFIEVLGMEMIEGRSFSEEFTSPNNDVYEVLLNETAVKSMGLENPVGQKINIWGGDKIIVGIVKDFSESIYDGNVKPMVFMHLINRGFGAFNTITVKLDNSFEVARTIKDIESYYSQFNPNFPFNYKFLDQDYQSLYAAERKLSILSKYFAILAILISCLGLYGLTAFTINKRRREIGVRKVMGSSGFQIMILLFKDVSKLVLVSLFLGIPICYLLAQNWLENFSVRIDLEPWFFVVSGGLFFVLMIIASGFQVVRTLSISPSIVLRNEA
ncbi:ABC transporter permease [Maribacter sp. 2307UL18-2]|uniref:ABC transporter permease n=1 Tax=Maribacter sp. 2307UL18-2 TaxID=3386274 RepID=UPI0039BD1711